MKFGVGPHVFAALLILLLAPVSASAQWLRAESPNFIVYATGDEAQLREHVALLEDFDGLLRILTGTKAPPAINKLPIYLARGHGQLRVASPRLHQDVLGFYAARTTGILAFADMTDRSDLGRENVLFHEYAHHFMLQYFPAAYPPWYVEGFAEFLMNSRFDGNVVEFGRVNRDRALLLTSEGNWLPMDRVLFGKPLRRAVSWAPFKFYAQSWIIVHYFLSDPERRAALARYLTAIERGADPEASFQSEIGLTPEQLRVQLRAYIRGRGIPSTRVTRASAHQPSVITVAELPPSASDLLLIDAALKIGLGEKDAPTYLQRTRRAAEAHPGDAFDMRVLARAEAFHGDGAAADRLLDRLLADAPDDGELLYLRGTRHLVAAKAAEGDAAAAEFKQAQGWFAKAHRADPNHYPTLHSYAESLRDAPAYRSENTANILLLAHQLAPQVGTIRLNAATMLMNLARFEEASGLLVSLVANSHYETSETMKEARVLLDQAKAGQRPGDLRIEEAEDAEAETREDGENDED